MTGGFFYTHFRKKRRGKEKRKRSIDKEQEREREGMKGERRERQISYH